MSALLTQALLHSIWQITALASLLWGALQLVSKQNSGLRYIFALTCLYSVPVLFVITCLVLSKPEAHFAATSTRQSSVMDYSKIIMWLWIIGGVVHVSRLYKSTTDLHRLLNTPMRAAPETIQRRFSALLEQISIGRKVSLFLTENVSGACAAAYLKPVILLPPAYLTQLSIDEIEAILAHELAHIKRHDGLHRVFQALIETLFYFHPCLHWMSQHVSTEREHACDDLAVTLLADRHHLATGLLKANLVQAENSLLLSAQSHSFMVLEARIRRLIPLAATRSSRRMRIATPIILAFVLSVVSAVAVVLPSWTALDDTHSGEFSRAQLVSLKNDVCDHLGARELYWTPPYNRSGAASLHVAGDKVFMNGSELPAEDQAKLKSIFEHHRLSLFEEVRLRYYGDDVKLIVSSKDEKNNAPYVYLTRSGSDRVDTFRLSEPQQS